MKWQQSLQLVSKDYTVKMGHHESGLFIIWTTLFGCTGIRGSETIRCKYSNVLSIIRSLGHAAEKQDLERSFWSPQIETTDRDWGKSFFLKSRIKSKVTKTKGPRKKNWKMRLQNPKKTRLCAHRHRAWRVRLQGEYFQFETMESGLKTLFTPRSKGQGETWKGAQSKSGVQSGN